MSRMLQYHQDILDRISHADSSTFRKELRKAIKRLSVEERDALKHWFRTQCICRPEQGAPGRSQLK